MNTITGRDRIVTILLIFLALNVIGDLGNVAFWWANPDSQGSLNGRGTIGGMTFTGGAINTAVGPDNALYIGSAILVIVAVAFLICMFGLLKRQTWAPLLVITIAIANRVIAAFLFEFSAAFAFWTVWTVILVVVSFLAYRKLSTPAQQLSAT